MRPSWCSSFDGDVNGIGKDRDRERSVRIKEMDHASETISKEQIYKHVLEGALTFCFTTGIALLERAHSFISLLAKDREINDANHGIAKAKEDAQRKVVRGLRATRP